MDCVNERLQFIRAVSQVSVATDRSMPMSMIAIVTGTPMIVAVVINQVKALFSIGWYLRSIYKTLAETVPKTISRLYLASTPIGCFLIAILGFALSYECRLAIVIRSDTLLATYDHHVR